MRLTGVNELEREAVRFFKTLSRGEEATVVTLSGPLGAGKTAFVQAVATVAGVEERLVSPTFVIEKVYALPSPPFERLVHIDAYRLQKEEELLSLGWHNLISNSGNLIMLEWPERVPGIIPANAKHLKLEHIQDGVHSLEYENN